MSTDKIDDRDSSESALEGVINKVFLCEDVDAQHFVLQLCCLLPQEIRRKLPADTIPILISEFISSEEGPELVKKAFRGWRQDTLHGEFDKDMDEPWHVVAAFVGELFSKVIKE